MTNEDFVKKTNEIREKLGEENANLILNELNELNNDNLSMNNDISQITKEKEDLNSKYLSSIETNSKLFQQIGVQNSNISIQKNSQIMQPNIEKEKFSFSSIYDEKRKF